MKPRISDNTPLKIVTLDIMQHIRDVIKCTITPSWINSIPSNFGHAAASQLRADEWHTISTIYLPLDLVSLWGKGTSHSLPDIGAHLPCVLDHTMALVSTITLACLQTTTDACSIV